MSQFRTLINHRITQFILLVIGIFCISLLAIQPFTLNQMPESADGLLHLYRVTATDYSLKVDNPLWVRYSTGIVYGYGAPLFNYFPPLSYYLGSWLHTFGLTFVQSWLMQIVAAPMVVNPYKGLRAFQEADSQDFYGREKLVTRLLQRMFAPILPSPTIASFTIFLLR